MKKLLIVIAVSLVLLGLAGCAASPNELVNVPNDAGEIAGFWQGLWHGFISPFTFLISLFSKTVHIYETHNNGGWYNFGFMVGVSAIFGGGGRGAARRRK
ncbi:MAG: hypothetical protein PVF83_00585 [Anaerolineales bacterium]|jgi:hypothetical protein